MARLLPEELWRQHLLERYYAFKLSSDWRLLRKEGLRILGRETLLTVEQWWASGKSQSSKEYHAWYEKCRIEGQRFGLLPWVVEMTCLLKNYNPENELIGIQWPKVRVVTEHNDPKFVSWLAYNAKKLGLYVIHKQNSNEVTVISQNPSLIDPPSMPSSMPLFREAFYLRFEIPVDYPPKGTSKLIRGIGLLSKDLLKLLGYPGFQRIRISSLIKQAETLDVNKQRLSRRKLYEVIATSASKEELEGDLSDISVENDLKRTKVLKSRKHQLRKRLVRPYDKGDKTTDS
ncbi:MAG: hypothetical protein PHF74_05360 [Dehalococcoidales bacterium]|nr:hypothetical protein [Dehalococcoidales bacterium]